MTSRITKNFLKQNYIIVKIFIYYFTQSQTLKWTDINFEGTATGFESYLYGQKKKDGVPV